MTEEYLENHRDSRFGLIGIVISAIALAVSLWLFFGVGPNQPVTAEGEKAVPGLLKSIEEDGDIDAGYGVYPPYTKEDPNTDSVSGFSVEMIEHIAKQLNAEVEWHRMNWNTMSADLKRGEFDVIADPIFQTIPRAREFTFTEPYAYFADGIAVVGEGNDRFSDFQSLDQEGITVAVGQGWASETLVKARFSNAEIMPVQTESDLLQVFNAVVSGRADVAVADAADAQRFVTENPESVKALFLENPPAYMPAGFALRPSDQSGAEFLNACLRNMEATGVIGDLAEKYDIADHTKLEN